jgi:glyoxylase-like metal-dependent hydrolase (beta-lactamase superfamily II)
MAPAMELKLPNELEVRSFLVGPLENNTYLVWDHATKEAVIVDPGLGSEVVKEAIISEGLKPIAILNTHGHFDHASNNGFFASAFGCPVFIHEADVHLLEGMAEHAAMFGFTAQQSPRPSGYLSEGEKINVGRGFLTVYHTPGHSPGGVCLGADGFVLTGDTLFAQSIGRTDLPGGSYEQLLDSIRRKLFSLPDETEALPGHGPSTSIGYEKRHNPFVRL